MLMNIGGQNATLLTLLFYCQSYQISETNIFFLPHGYRPNSVTIHITTKNGLKIPYCFYLFSYHGEL